MKTNKYGVCGQMLRGLRGIAMAVAVMGVAGCGGPRAPSLFPSDLKPGTVDAATTGPNSWRVIHAKAPGIRIGSCATEDGGFLPESCVNSSLPTLEPDLALRPDLNEGEFHYYSRLLNVDAAAAGSAGVGSAEAKIVVTTHRVVVEWTRYRTQPMPSGLTIKARPLVNGLDVGIALRLIFDIKISQQEADASASFGFGQIASSIAAKQADVAAHFEQRGTTFDFVPSALVTISSVEDFIKALNAFYTSFTYMSKAWDAYVSGAPAADEQNPDIGAGVESKSVQGDPTQFARDTIVPVRKPDSARVGTIFKPAVIAYHISGMPNAEVTFNAAYAAGYVYGAEMVANKQSCAATKAALAGQSKAFRKGAMRVYRDLLATQLCGDDEVSAAQAEAAAKSLPDGPSDE